MPQDQDPPISLEDFEEQRRQYYGIPKGLAESLKTQESNGRQYDRSGNVLTSPKQAKGRYQVLQSTADKYNLNASDPFDNVEASFRYLSDLNKQVDKNVTDPGERWAQTLAGYHAGDRRLQEVNRTGNLPTTSDGKIRTDQYVGNIMDRWQRYDQERSGQTPTPQATPTRPQRRMSTAERLGIKPAEGMEFDLGKSEGKPPVLTGKGPARMVQPADSQPAIRPESKFGPLYESLRDQSRRAFEQKPLLQRGYERAYDALARGGGAIAKQARQTLEAGMGVAKGINSGDFSPVPLESWRKFEQRRNTELEVRRHDRPSSLATDIGEGIIEAAPQAGAALLLTEAGVPPWLASGGMSAAGADWNDPKRAAAQTAIGTLAPAVGKKIGGAVGGAVANRLTKPAAITAATLGGELVGGGGANAAGTGAEELAFEGRLNPREMAKSGAIGTALTLPGVLAATGRPLAEPTAKLPRYRSDEGAIVAPESPLYNRPQLPPGNPEEIPTARLYQAEPPPRGRPMPPSTQELNPETFGYVPKRKALPPGNPEEVPTARLPQPTAPIAYPDATPTQEMPSFREWLAQENAPTSEIPAVKTGQTERRITAPGQEEGAIGRPVTQEYQLPGGLKKAESFASREDARQGHFDQFNDQELVDEIGRMQDVQNQARRGQSKLSPQELEANNFDLKVAIDQQKERLRLQRQIGVDPGMRIQPRTPSRPPKKAVVHPDPAINGQPVIAETQDGRVVVANANNKSGLSVVKDRSTGAIPAEAMPEMEGRTEPPIRPGARQSYAIPEEAMGEPPKRSRGTILGGGLGSLQGMFEGGQKAPPEGQQELFKGARREPGKEGGLGSAIGNVFRTASQGLRTFKTAFDLSAPLSQGAFLTRAHPLKGAQAFGKMIRSLSPAESAAIDQEILNHPLRKVGEESGLHLATGGAHEEAFMLGKLNKAPGIAASERTYRTYLDSLRLSVWESYVKSLQSSGYTPENNPRAYKQAAEFINIATGRGNLRPGSKLANAMALGGDILFAPRNLVSKFQLLDPVRYARLEPGARKIVLRDAITSFGTILGTAALLKQAGVNVGLNPTDDDFMEARWGNHRYDLTAGLKTEVKFLAKMIGGAYNQFSGEGNLPNQDPLSVAKNYARGKLAPGPGFAYDFFSGSDIKGQKLSDKSKTDIAVGFGPMIVEDLRDGYKDSGVTGMLKSTPSILGQRVNVRPDRAKAAFINTPGDLRDEQKKAGETRSFLTPRKGRGGQPDEMPAAFADRKNRADEWSNKYGSQLVESGAYKSAAPEIQKAAREYLEKQIVSQTDEKRPSLYLFNPGHILSTVRESAREKRRKAGR